jgi:hypothetical protein
MGTCSRIEYDDVLELALTRLPKYTKAGECHERTSQGTGRGGKERKKGKRKMALWREAVEKGGSLVDNIQNYYIHVKNQVSTAGSTPPPL